MRNDEPTRELLLPKIATVVEVAALVKVLPLQEGAKLIEQYARTFAAGARLDETLDRQWK